MANRILVVGLGSIGKRHLGIARKLCPTADIRVLRHQFSADLPEEADGAFFNLHDAINFSPHLAVIANPAPFHVEPAIALIEAGCHLLIEKPLSSNSANVKPLLRAIEKGSVVALVGYNLRFLAALSHFKGVIDKGGVGEVLSVRSEAGSNLKSWRPDTDYRESVSAQKILGGGVLLELSHELDYLRWIFGEISWVSGWVGQLGNLCLDVEDTATLILGIESDKSIVCSLNLDFVRNDPARSCTVIGSEGSLRWNGVLGTVEQWNSLDGSWDCIFNAASDLEQSYYRQWEHFLNTIENNGVPLITIADAAATLNVIEAAKQSSSVLGKRIYLNG